MSARIVVVGEALVDVVVDAGSETELPGGSPANVAVALGRLGHAPRLVTCLGDDARGDAVRAWLDESGVDLRAYRTASDRTSVARAVIGADGAATYEFDLGWRLPPEAVAEVDGADVVHVGSIATVLEPGAGTVFDVVRAARGHALVSFDPNARPAVTPNVVGARASVERLVALSDVVKVSAEDLAWYYPDHAPVDAAQRFWLGTEGEGPVLVVVTLGGDGSVLLRGSDVVRVAAPRVRVVDTIGAGDTYTGALLDALVDLGAIGAAARARLGSLSVDALRQAGAWAATAAAVTVSRPGADPPSTAEMVAQRAG